MTPAVGAWLLLWAGVGAGPLADCPRESPRRGGLGAWLARAGVTLSPRQQQMVRILAYKQGLAVTRQDGRRAMLTVEALTPLTLQPILATTQTLADGLYPDFEVLCHVTKSRAFFLYTPRSRERIGMEAEDWADAPFARRLELYAGVGAFLARAEALDLAFTYATPADIHVREDDAADALLFAPHRLYRVPGPVQVLPQEPSPRNFESQKSRMQDHSLIVEYKEVHLARGWNAWLLLRLIRELELNYLHNSLADRRLRAADSPPWKALMAFVEAEQQKDSGDIAALAAVVGRLAEARDQVARRPGRGGYREVEGTKSLCSIQ